MIVTSVAGDFWSGFLGGLIAALLFSRRPHEASPTDQLAAMAEVRREQMTETDISNERSLATALEEYAVDHNGQYPARLRDIIPSPYLRGDFYVPGSDPPATYVYEHPAADPAWGEFDIRDDGSLDPSLDKLLNVTTKRRCTKGACKFIIYTQANGVVGSP